MKRWASLVLALGLTACVHAPLSPGALYVAMGSSFAAGSGVTSSADTPGTRCGRSIDNYAHQVARRRKLTLVDVSCGGAMTRHLLEAWNELPPQLDALTPDTRLVTITIGGNDLGYIGGLMAGSCLRPEGCAPVAAPDEAAYAGLEQRMHRIVAEVRRRAPHARLIFVDYGQILPPQGVCAVTPMSEAQAEIGRGVAQRLAAITAAAARRGGAEVLEMSRLSQGHDACAGEPWMNGFPIPGRPVDGTPYHPNLASMNAAAASLEAMLAE